MPIQITKYLLYFESNDLNKKNIEIGLSFASKWLLWHCLNIGLNGQKHDNEENFDRIEVSKSKKKASHFFDVPLVLKIRLLLFEISSCRHTRRPDS